MFPALLVLAVLHLTYTTSAPILDWQKRIICSNLGLPDLEGILGGAFNPRYMSIEQPPEPQTLTGKKRNSFYEEDFFVDDDFMEEVDPEPAWKVSNHVSVAKKRIGLHRRKRGIDYMQKWQCESKIVWNDLGPDYFPRFLRSVTCVTENCWFGIYKCKPKSFTVKLLRRKRNYCGGGDRVKSEDKVGLIGLPVEFKEMWVWEERAVTFCCDCTRN